MPNSDITLYVVWTSSGASELTYQYNDVSSSLTITRCYSDNIVIPKIYKNIPVTSIGNNAFSDCSNIIEVTIPNSITSIGKNSFSNCTSLTNITIPNSVTSIGTEAFSGCGLTDVMISDSMTSIGDYAFENCTNLTNITLSNTLTNIGAAAFNGCKNIKDITFNGTSASWKTLTKNVQWKDVSQLAVVHCTDGDVTIK